MFERVRLMGNVTNGELHKLYEAAIAFRDLKPWKWMYASQVFIVHDDEKDIDGFCSIMGMMGEHFSFSVYLGQSGYQSYRYLYDKASLAYMDHVFMKAEVRRHCLKVSYENLENLTDSDEEQAVHLGYKFKDDHQWPRFRYHHPGVYSWYLSDGWQCRFLTKALEQAIIVAKLEKEKLLKVTEVYDSKYYLRYQTADGWEGKFVDSSLFLKSSSVRKIIFQNDLLVYKLKKLPKLLISLEVIQFYLPNPVVVLDSNQPFYMMITALVDSEEGHLFFLDIQETAALYLEQTVMEFAKQLLELQIRPCEIIAEDEEVYRMLEDFCCQSEIKLTLSQNVLRAHEFAEYIYEELQNASTGHVKVLTSDEDESDESKLLSFTEQITDTLQSQQAINHLTISQQEHYKVITQTFVLAMYTIKDQIPTEWTPDAVKDICLTVLPEQLEQDKLKEARDVLNHFITVLGEDEVVPYYRSILLVINNCL